MSPHRRRRAPRSRVLATAAVALSLGVTAACSGGDDPAEESPTPAASGSAAATPTAEASASPYLPVPDDVELTQPGSELDLDEGAVVAWQPRQDLVGVLDVKVEELLRTTLEESFQGWRLDEQVTEPRPYFVTASIRNVGDTDLGGQQVPLYVVDGRNRLIESSRFADRFAACPSTPFPKTFAPGDRVEVCLVYLVPNSGRLMAVSFRPHEEFNPITWTGQVRPLSKARADDEKPGDRPDDKAGDRSEDDER